MTKANLKTVCVTTALLVPLAIAPAASAQIGVYDSENEAKLEDILDKLEEIRVEADLIEQELVQFEEFRNEQTQPYYDTMQASLGYYTRTTSGTTEVDGADPFQHSNDETAGRIKLRDAHSGGAAGYGIDVTGSETTGGPTGDAATGLAGYQSEYGLLASKSVHKDGSALAKELRHTYNALYMAETTAFLAHEAREARLTAYTNLETAAQNANSLREAIDVNNALLVENGRNLTTLIALQTADMNAQSAAVRRSVISDTERSRQLGVENGQSISNVLGSAPSIISAVQSIITATANGNGGTI